MGTQMQPTAIDHEALGELEDWSRAWTITLGSGLSERYVPGEGDSPRVMLVGEAPGAQEDMALRPFVGPAGRIQRELMAGVGLFTGLTPHFGTANCWLTNLVHFRPPGNRNPTPQEIYLARAGLQREWQAIGTPRIVVAIGGIAFKAIMGEPLSILKMSGRVIERKSKMDGKKIFIVPMIHPSFGLRQKSMIPLIEKDWDHFNVWLRRTAVLT